MLSAKVQTKTIAGKKTTLHMFRVPTTSADTDIGMYSFKLFICLTK